MENRPFPYLTVDADLLSNLRQSAAEGLFHSFDLLVGKDATIFRSLYAPDSGLQGGQGRCPDSELLNRVAAPGSHLFG